MDAFALHDPPMQKKVYDNWVLKATWPWALPSDVIRAYFGEKVQEQKGKIKWGKRKIEERKYKSTRTSLCFPIERVVEGR